jgi:transposase
MGGESKANMYPVLGIDISKDKLDVALACAAGAVTVGVFDNRPHGFQQLVRWLRRQLPHLPADELRICLEATGRYGEAVAEYLHAEGYWVSVINPLRLHAYSRSQLRRSKTDRQDAKLLADFAATQELRQWLPMSEQQQTLRELTRQVAELKQSLRRVKNRLDSGLRTPSVRRVLEEQQTLLDKQIADLEAEIQTHLAADPEQAQQYRLLCSIPGLGPITAAKFLAEVPDFRRFDDADQLAAYAGLVPRQCDSGSSVHRKGVLAKGGNSYLRTAFYMPALRAHVYNPVVAALVTRLQAKGKSKMTTIGAVMHKLLVLAYGVLKSGLPFDPNYGHAT